MLILIPDKMFPRFESFFLKDLYMAGVMGGSCATKWAFAITTYHLNKKLGFILHYVQGFWSPDEIQKVKTSFINKIKLFICNIQ